LRGKGRNDVSPIKGIDTNQVEQFGPRFSGRNDVSPIKGIDTFSFASPWSFLVTVGIDVSPAKGTQKART
jgi:hypothetical protein